MARFNENFKAVQDECPITIIKGGEVVTMTTKQYRQMIAKKKREAEKKAQTNNV